MRGYNRFPDEKGTERIVITLRDTDLIMYPVTIVSPMKRGLKVRIADELRSGDARPVTIVSPMKRGLKGYSETKIMRQGATCKLQSFPR